MKGHKYFIEGIPKDLWKDFRQACLYFDTTAKHYFIFLMNELVKRHHRSREDSKAGPIYHQKKEKKK